MNRHLFADNLLVGDGGSVCGGLEPPLDVGASQVGQWAPLLKPAAQRRLNIAVDIPAEEKTLAKLDSLGCETSPTPSDGCEVGAEDLKCVANSLRWKV